MTASDLSSYWWAVLLIPAGYVLYRVFRKKVDIKRPELDPNLDWSGKSDEALSKVYAYVVALSVGTIAWYQTRRGPKRSWGVFLRVGALVATAAAGFVPLSEDLISIDIPGAWTTVLVAGAGMLVSIDSLAGHTSGWVRYMLAQQKVERLRDVFVLEWNALRVAGADAKGMLTRAQTFAAAVGKVTEDETQEWATEFQNALKQMERARRTAAEAEHTGAIEVSVKNPQAVQGWILEIDGNERGRTFGKTIAITDAVVGIRKLRVHGQDPQGKRLSDEKAVKVEGATTVTTELELS